MGKNTIYDEIYDILMIKYPRSGQSTRQTEEEWESDVKFLLPKIISLYNFCKTKAQDDISLLEWVYYFSRRIRFIYEHEREEPGIVEYYDVFKEIQTESINYHLNPGITEQQRLESGQLYKTGYGIIMAGSIPRAGSSSMCSNCFEPIAFAQTVCYCCHYPLIGPHGYRYFSPTDWKELTPRVKNMYHIDAFIEMGNDIRGKGLGRAWNDPEKQLEPLYKAMGIK